MTEPVTRIQREGQLRRSVLSLLQPLHPVHIESPTTKNGIPDVNCIAGWIELKRIMQWPKGDDVLINPPHYTPDQRNFLRDRCKRGGKAWLLVQIERAWVLFWGTFAADWVGVTLTKGELLSGDYRRYGTSFVMWDGMPTSAELIKALTMTPWK